LTKEKDAETGYLSKILELALRGAKGASGAGRSGFRGAETADPRARSFPSAPANLWPLLPSSPSFDQSSLPPHVPRAAAPWTFELD
jgi:hypothetical protein